jgi:hypothetical protein
MQTGTLTTHTEKPSVQTQPLGKPSRPGSRSPFAILLVFIMGCAIIFTGTVLPLQGLFFYSAMPNTSVGHWLLLPTRLLFPGKAIVNDRFIPGAIPSIASSTAWHEVLLLTFCAILLFGLYLLALRVIAPRISLRFILITSIIFGFAYILYPAVTSQDIFSYIIYARIGTIYHLNPLTTLPTAIPHDQAYSYVFWTTQPSAYGPIWAGITCALQWVALLFGLKSVLSMVFLLRFWGLLMQLGSTVLIWKLSGSFQRFTGTISERRRLIATMAFAWNPLLIFEACVNGHVDTTILFLVLLAIWFLQPRSGSKTQPYLMAAALLAFVTCIKITMVVLVPGLILYLWLQQPRRVKSVVGAIVTYSVVVILLYAPFWQHGAVLDVLRVNPGVTRDANSPYEFVIHLYESLRNRPTPFINSNTGTPIEIFTHKFSMVLYILLYAIICLRCLAVPQRINNLPALVKWMALVWLLYCIVGSPWFWPWYLTTFLGLFALVEATGDFWHPFSAWLQMPLATRLLSFALFGLYIFATWEPHVSPVPYLPYFTVIYFRGFALCLIPLLAIRLPQFAPVKHRFLIVLHKFSLEPKRT